MKIIKIIICSIVLFTIGYIIGYTVCVQQYKSTFEANELKREMISLYENYYDATEALLDTLDNHYDWVDAFDPEDYYVSIEKIDSLYATQL